MKTFIFLLLFTVAQSQNLVINEQGYFEMPGLNVTVFSDIYPEGHQTGVTIIQHGRRVAANGDVRLEASPGQWSPVPKGGKLTVDREHQKISQQLWYPDSSKNRRGFNPVIYPDLHFKYQVSVQALQDNAFMITVDLDQALDAEWAGRIGFNLELFPGHLFGKSYIMDQDVGYFPVQPGGPVHEMDGEYLAQQMARGGKLVIAPESDSQRISIESLSGELILLDGRTNHNNGWYIIRGLLPANTSEKALQWIVKPHVINNWIYQPVIQVSQLGYYPQQPKKVIIEQDKKDKTDDEVRIVKVTATGKRTVKNGHPRVWGGFLRYRYLTFNFSDIREKGLYLVEYRGKSSHAFRIDDAVFERDAWQPVIEYYLPVQMCHLRVNEKYRVWHGACHLDDALMAPVDTNHFDGYKQGASTLTTFQPYQPVPYLNKGGWHDAGDYDLRIESQIGTIMLLALMVEEFGLDYDATTIDQEKGIVEIHQPDGKNDLIQQIEHGLLSVLGGYKALGRLYRGIICNDLRQYVLLGDGSTMTDNMVFRGQGVMDDRWVFTEENPERALGVAAGLAAAARVLQKDNPVLAKECLITAHEIWQKEKDQARRPVSLITALCELYLATGDTQYEREILKRREQVTGNLRFIAPSLGRVIHKIEDSSFKKEIADSVAKYMSGLIDDAGENSPYGVPYKPRIWGAGWDIQRFGVAQYFIHKGWPELGSTDLYLNALQFILGVHPGENNASFASGVGAQSVLTAYGVNRADWSFIPGGVASGTALIRPDLPELKEWPFFWQQTEYVMGGGSTNYMFLVLAAQKLYKNNAY